MVIFPPKSHLVTARRFIEWVCHKIMQSTALDLLGSLQINYKLDLIKVWTFKETEGGVT